MEIIHEEPRASSYVPVSEHQSQTPSSFYSGPVVLYHESSSADLVILDSELASSPALSKLADDKIPSAAATNGDAGEHQGEEIVVPGVDIWVTSEYVLNLLTARRGTLLTRIVNSFSTVNRLQ